MDGAPAMKWVESLVYGDDGAQKQKATTAAQPRVAPALVSHRLSLLEAALPKTTTPHAVQE
jgi:hypothetical protein